MRYFPAFAFFGMVVALTATELPAQTNPVRDMRDWTSDDGKTIRAQLVGYDGNEAQLRLENGQRVSISDSRFAPGDQAELVRDLITESTWSKLPPPQSTRYYYSPKTSEHDTHEKIVAQMAFGPNYFSYGLKVHSKKVDLNDYSRLTFSDGAGGVFDLDYKPAEVATWGDSGRETTRVVAGIQIDRNAKLIPVLKKGLESKSLTIHASTKGNDARQVDISRDEIDALGDLFTLFHKALPLVQSGVIKKELLENQKFAAGTPAAGANMTAKDDPALERFKSSQGGGRFGEITWTPAGGQATAVRGLGWIDQFVVIRTAQDEVKKVPFLEIDKDNRKKILEARLDDFAGTKPPSDSNWISYYSKELEGNQTTYSQGFVFKRAANSGEPHLFLQTYATKFEGKAISSFVISADSQPKSFTVANDTTKTVVGDDHSWSVASQNLAATSLNELAGLADCKNLKIVVYSGNDSAAVHLSGDQLVPSTEALAFYLWAKEINN